MAIPGNVRPRAFDSRSERESSAPRNAYESVDRSVASSDDVPPGCVGVDTGRQMLLSFDVGGSGDRRPVHPFGRYVGPDEERCTAHALIFGGTRRSTERAAPAAVARLSAVPLTPITISKGCATSVSVPLSTPLMLIGAHAAGTPRSDTG